MSKLPEEYKFIDLSDCRRPIARLITNSLKKTSYMPIAVARWFIISGLIGVVYILGVLFGGGFFFNV